MVKGMPPAASVPRDSGTLDGSLGRRRGGVSCGGSGAMGSGGDGGRWGGGRDGGGGGSGGAEGCGGAGDSPNRKQK